MTPRAEQAPAEPAKRVVVEGEGRSAEGVGVAVWVAMVEDGVTAREWEVRLDEAKISVERVGVLRDGGTIRIRLITGDYIDIPPRTRVGRQTAGYSEPRLNGRQIDQARP